MDSNIEELSPDQQKEQKKRLEQEFVELFSETTQYAQLDQLIRKTLTNKDNLLQVLDCPALPLHNNAAELAVRRMVRKRDISLHTMSPAGTRVRDAFLSIVQTASKLGVNAMDYIADRVSGKSTMPSLAQLVKLAYQGT